MVENCKTTERENVDNPRWFGPEPCGEIIEGPYAAIIRTNKGWFFYDEVFSDVYGPFGNRADATEDCLKYAATL